jgi:hypothetical protein
MSEKQGAMKSSTAPQDARLEQVAGCLLDYLNVHGKNAQIYQVLRFLAENTLSRLAEGKDARFNYFSIRKEVTQETEGDASAWFSRHWKSLNGDFRQRCEEGLQKFSADQGLDVYPWVEKHESDGGAGNQALISLIALPITAISTANDTSPHDITYIPMEKLKLSWWARWLFDENQVAEGWRKWLLIWPTLLYVMFTAVGSIFILFVLSISKHPVTTSDLAAILFIIIFNWIAYRALQQFIRLVDDRIIMASDSMVGFREFGACLELFRPNAREAGAPKKARMIKYAAQCPVCAAQVLLDAGEPDFPRRIVGRCQESPREHVFSFDRVTRGGYRLR